MKGKARMALLLVGVALGSISTTAFAQTATQSGDQTIHDDGANAVEELVITGSRVVRDGFTAPTPVTVITAENLTQTAPNTVADALRQLPALFNSANSRQAPGMASGDANASSGSYLNLRNLGNNRMLLLQDGLRVPPTRADGQTDSNVLPQMLISRVDVVTGGASAVYGSDAVSGVVNYITDTRFKGLKLTSQVGISDRGDDESYRIGIAGGIGMADDRLRLIGSAERYYNAGIDSWCERDLGCEFWSAAGVNRTSAGSGTVSNPYTNYRDTRLANITFNGYVASGPAALVGNDLVNSANGAVIAPYNPGTVIGPGVCINCSGGYIRSDQQSLIPSVTTQQLYGRASYDFTDTLKGWTHVSYGDTETDANIISEFYVGNLTIFSGNAFLSPQVQAAFTPTQQSFTLNKVFLDMPVLTHHSLSRSINWAAGLDGALGENWDWKVYGAIGESSLAVDGYQAENAKLYAALDAVRDGAGNIVCRVDITNPGVHPGCKPLNPFGVAASPEAIAYVRGQYAFEQTTTLETANASVTGEPFSTWAGPVSVAGGIEYRSQSLDVTSNAAPGNFQTTGIRYGNGPQLRFRTNNTLPTSGSYQVKEVFGEVILPLLTEKPFSKGLDLSLAGRLTDYSLSGEVTTWKAGLSWTVSDDLRFRATQSRDIRAPTLFDFFAPTTTGLSGLIDPHIQVNGGNYFAVTNVISGGNVNLEPEKADTSTIGLLYSPSQVPGLRLSLDYYDIQIEDALAQPYNISQMVTLCEADNGVGPICDAISRPLPFSDRTPANFPTSIRVQTINVSTLAVRGIDAELSYQRPMFGGTFDGRIIANYQPTYETVATPTSAVNELAGYGSNPKLNMLMQGSWRNDDWRTFLQVRRIGEVKKGPSSLQRSTNVWADPIQDPVYYFDGGITRELSVGEKEVEWFVNITNIFDQDPPLIPNPAVPGLTYPTNRQLYDVVGREYTTGVRVTF